jgi:hypothetical protein
MHTRLTITQGLWRPLVAGIVALALVVTLGAMSASAAKTMTCVVTNTDTGKTYTRLQQAVDAAEPGARLTVKGTCVGGAFIDKDLAIRGVKTRQTGKPIFDGGVQSYSTEGSTRLLTIKPKVKVSIRDLVIRDGKATRIPDGGGVSNKGKLTLRDVVVRDNYAAKRGGGIYNEGVLSMLGRTVVKNNIAAPGQGGTGSGVYNTGRLILDDGTRIIWNVGGFGFVNAGTLVMNGTSNISHSDYGRGVSGVWNSGNWTMNDASSISDQGQVVNPGTLVMNDASSIHHNRISGGPQFCATGAGGGVRNTGAITMNDSASIHDNFVFGGCGNSSAPYDRARGGGVYNEGSLTMTGSSRIDTNEAKSASNGVVGLGGGLYNGSGGTLDGVTCAPHTYANVYGNTPDDCYFE